MKSHTIKLKQENMLCYRCLLNVAQGLGQLKSIQGFDINLDSKRVKVIYNDLNISREEIEKIVNDSIENGVTKKH